MSIKDAKELKRLSDKLANYATKLNIIERIGMVILIHNCADKSIEKTKEAVNTLMETGALNITRKDGYELTINKN